MQDWEILNDGGRILGRLRESLESDRRYVRHGVSSAEETFLVDRTPLGQVIVDFTKAPSEETWEVVLQGFPDRVDRRILLGVLLIVGR